MFDKEQGRAEFVRVWERLFASFPARLTARLENLVEQANLGRWYVRLAWGGALLLAVVLLLPISLLIYLYLCLKLFLFPLLEAYLAAFRQAIPWHMDAPASHPTPKEQPNDR